MEKTLNAGIEVHGEPNSRPRHRMPKIEMDRVLKIRGIYATALTRFFLGQGFKVTFPSEAVRERLGGLRGFEVLQAPDAEILDLKSKQGILVLGDQDSLDVVASQMIENFLDAVTRRRAGEVLEIEFPLVSKSRLDEIRNAVVPTLFSHHRLKIIASDQIGDLENKSLSLHPETREPLSRAAEKDWVWDFYETTKEIAIEHVKPDGRVFHLSDGRVLESDFVDKRLVLKRVKSQGRGAYDGLGIPKLEGDYAISEIREGDWYYRHTYFRACGDKIGTYYNINTPVEFYPDKVRYVDLEIDVVQFVDGRVEVVDAEELDRQVRKNHLSEALLNVAKKEADLLMSRLRS